MPYESTSDNFTESSFNDDIDSGFIDPDNLSVRESLLLSDDEFRESEVRGDENSENSEYDSDYSGILGNIDSTTTLSLEQIESLVVQLDNLNENIVVMNENIRLGVGFIFAITIILCVRVIFSLFNKILGLGQA